MQQPWLSAVLAVAAVAAVEQRGAPEAVPSVQACAERAHVGPQRAYACNLYICISRKAHIYL